MAADAKIIFEFDDEKPVSQRLSVFAEFSSNVRRLDYITVNIDNYSWTIENPLLIQSGDRMWGGYMHLEPPPNLKTLPKGQYTFECVDAAGNKAQGGFFVEYEDNLLKEKFSSALFPDSKWKDRIAVYSEELDLLYYEKPRDGWVDEKTIFSSVKNSFLFRRVYESSSVICLGPKRLKSSYKHSK